MSNRHISTVDFHGHPLTVITTSGQKLVAMKPICEGIGLQWEAQLKRIKRHPIMLEGMSIMDTPSAGGTQAMVCLPLSMLNGWLFGVEASRVRPEIRDTLLMYQRECFAVLAAYWQEGEAVNPRKRQPKALPNGLTLEQQDAIKGLVKARVEALPEDKRAKGAITLWSALKSRFGCTYKKIETELYAEAVSLVARVELEGEYIEREDYPSQRVLISRDYLGRKQVTPVPNDACVMTPRQLMRAINEPGGLIISTEELADFLVQTADNLRRRVQWQNELNCQTRASGSQP